MAIDQITLVNNGQKVERRYLLTVAEWTEDAKTNREVLGIRTEDSSIELNPDTETMTDIVGYTYTDVNKTEPQQDFDPYNLLGNSKLGAYLNDAFLTNNITAYSNAFTVYIVELFLNPQTDFDNIQQRKYSSITDGFTAVMHANCSIIPTSIGGDSYISMPIEVHFSNKITKGKVTFKDNEDMTDFAFTATADAG